MHTDDNFSWRENMWLVCKNPMVATMVGMSKNPMVATMLVLLFLMQFWL